MEMLIVVAIIAVLVAIAIPTFNSALTKSKEAADVANIRAAYAEMMMAYMMDDTKLTVSQIEGKIKPLNFDGTGYLKVDTNSITYTATKLENSKETDTKKKHVFTWSVQGLATS